MKSIKINHWKEPDYDWVEDAFDRAPPNKQLPCICDCTVNRDDDGLLVAWTDCTNCFGYGFMPIDWVELK